MMKVFTFIEVISRFHQYMMHGHTGDANTFATKLGISRASLYRILSELSDYGVHIEYCREQQTYQYVFPERVEINIVICEHSDKEK